MERFESAIEVDCRVRTVYNQWTQFEEFPRFMGGVEQVLQLDDTHLYWCANVGGMTKDWESEITEQVPDQRIAWKSISGAPNAGSVHFEPIDADRTRVTLKIAYDPQGLTESLGDALGVVARRIEAALRDFKSFIEERGSESGAWRGEVHPGPAAVPAAWRGEVNEDRAAGDAAAASAGGSASGAARSQEGGRTVRHSDGEAAGRGESLGRRSGRGPLDMTEEPSGLVGGMGSHAASAFASGSPIGLGGTDEPLLWSPRVKVAEQGDEFVVTATLPCVSRDEVTVEIEGAELVLRSERRSGHQTEGHAAIGLQSEDGVFYCAIPLPDRANPSSARASMDNGVLTITLHAPPPRRRGRRVLIEGA